MTEVHVTDQMTIPLRDGRILSARMWRPQDAGPLPVILEIHPYPHAYATATRDEINHGWFAAHGYVALRVDTPGTGDSDGRLWDTYRPDELATIRELLTWVEVQDWCNGAIGMFGHSWGAYNALQMAAQAPDALKAVAFSGASDNLYTEDCHWRGGVMATENMGWAATLLSFLSRPPTQSGFGQDRTQKWIDRLEAVEFALPTWLEHQARDEYWHSASVCDDYSRVSVPVLTASGWADTYCTSVLRMAEHLPGPFTGVVGPWAHKFPHMGMPEPAIGWLQEVTRWWNHWLKGIDTGADTLPRLRAFIGEDQKPEAQSASVREGRWISLPDRPEAPDRVHSYHLGHGTLSDAPQSGTTIIASPQSLGVEGGELMPMGWGSDLPGDQRADDGQSVVFDTQPLDAPIDVLGRVRLDLTITSDQPVGFIVARLCDIHPDGSSTRVCFGAHNLTHNHDHSVVTHLEPGTPTRISFELDATGYRFIAEHRMRLALSNAYWPLLWPSPRPVRLSLALEDATLTLPLLPDAAQDDVTFDPVEGADARPRPEQEAAQFERTVLRDQANEMTTFRVLDVSARTHDPTRDLTTWGSTDRNYVVTDDLSNVSMRAHREVNLLDGTHHLQTVTEAIMTCDADSFQTDATLVAYENGKELVRRVWKTSTLRNGT